MSIKEANVTINVKDMDKSILFYESLGLTIKKRWANYYTQLEAPGILIGLHPAGDTQLPGNSGNVSIGFTTGNFEDTRAALEKLFIKTTERQEEGGQFLHFTDPDGTALYFIQPRW